MAVCPNCHEQNPEVGAACPRCEGYYYIPDEAYEDSAGDPLIGRMTAGKYVILSLINEGGMGAVYRALQLPVEREVAFKVLRTELKDSDNGRDRFIREARAVSRLNHANIITLYDFGFDDDKHPYMVMEYAPGRSLGKWLKQDDITMERILRVTAQVLSALTEAHSRGIVHRDLKPENMIVSQRGSDPDYVKLLDFGIARMINERATKGLTREGEVFGTPHYMAPEQAQGKKEVGPPADIYAVGIMMWEMISGECPFDAPTPLAVLFMHISDELPALRPRSSIVHNTDVELIIRRACEKEPMNRYQTAGEMLADILSVIGFSTGVLPGMIGTDASAEFGSSEMRRSSALNGSITSQAASRAPHFTPTASDSFGSGVRVKDPNPSVVTGFETGQLQTVAASNKRLGIVAAVAVVAVLGALAALFAIASGDPNEAEGSEVTVTEPVDPNGAEVVAKTAEIEVVPIDEPELAVELVPDGQEAGKEPGEETADAQGVAAESAPKQEVAEKTPTEKTPEKTVASTKSEPAPTKTVQKWSTETTTVTQKKTDPKPAPEEKTVKPGKWKPPAKQVTPTTWR